MKNWHCEDCNWYCKERRICIRTGYFNFPSMPACGDFLEGEDCEEFLEGEDCEE